MASNTAARDQFFRDHPTYPEWTAVDKYTLSNLHPSSRPNHAALEKATSNATAKGLPAIASSTTQAKFLALQCRMLKARHALEIGTLAGYTAIWLATENPDLQVTTLEYNPDNAKVALENITAAGVSTQIKCIVGPALDTMPQLHEDIKNGKKEKLDFAFIDADKSNNWNYFDWAVKMSRPGACIIVDNVVLWGYLADPEGADKLKQFGFEGMVEGAREVVEKVGKDERVDATVLQVVGEKGYDGFLMAVVK